VTILYTITFILALHRQNPRIRALKKSLNVLNKFDAYPSNHHERKHYKQKQRNDSIGSSYSPLRSSVTTRPTITESKGLSANDNHQLEMSSFISTDDLDDQNSLTKPKNNQDYHISVSEATSDDLQISREKMTNIKQVSFQIENSDNILINNEKEHLSSLSYSFDDRNTDTYYKFPCPCSTTRQLLIKFHFAQPTLDVNQWLCYCCMKKKPSSSASNRQISIISTNEDEISTTLSPASSNHHNHTSPSNSETLKRQLHRHRIKQIRMASTFLLITVSFVLFYLPSILNAERYIKSPLMIYYLYLWTHALNPLIYCFMNISLRAYVFSMLKCRTKQKQRSSTGATSVFDR
jgi:hypothetical protein